MSNNISNLNHNILPNKTKTKKNRKKPIQIFFCLLLVVFVLGGCVPKISEPEFTFKESEQNAESAREILLQADKNKKDMESYHADLKMEATVYVPTFLSMYINCPLELKSSIDSGKGSAHETGSLKGSLFGISKNSKHESYYDNREGKGYYRAKGEDSWKDIHTNNPMEILMDYEKMANIIPESTQFHEKNDTYIVTINAKDINILEILSAMNPSVGKAIATANIQNGALIYEFDKKTMFPKQISVSGLELRQKTSGKDYKIVLEGDIPFSKINEVEEAKYRIPEKLLKTN